MKILLTGASGQVGYELERSLQGIGEVVSLAAGTALLKRSWRDRDRLHGRADIACCDCAWPEAELYSIAICDPVSGGTR
jgi:dTDP-4-dehydrorhamnose reductase